MKTKVTQVILNDLFSDWLTGGGFFSILSENTDVPWKSSVDGDILDLEYHGNRSGTKIIAPLLGRMIVNNEISDENKSRLAVLAFLRFGQNWGKLWNTLSLQYNPIENYDMKETENATVNVEGSFSETNGVFGFDSNASVNRDTREGDNDGKQTTSRGLNRHGNIGVTTSQQMIQSERDLWLWKFFDSVFADVDTLIVTGAFGNRCGDLSLDIVPYHLPIASENKLGGIKAPEKTAEQTTPVYVDENGFLWVGVTGYTLPVASASDLGGIKANSKTEDDTTPVRIDENGFLWVKFESGLPSYTAENNGDFLRVLNGSPAWDTVPDAGGELF